MRPHQGYTSPPPEVLEMPDNPGRSRRASTYGFGGMGMGRGGLGEMVRAVGRKVGG